MPPDAFARPEQDLSSAPRETLRSVAILGSYLPRRCGLATFTSDLVGALRQIAPALQVLVAAINDRKEGYDYPDEVRFEIADKQLADHRAAADFLNAHKVDALCVQHEFGIFGGIDGSHLLKLLHRLRVPIVTTLHTVLRVPSDGQRAIVRELAALSDRLVVMTPTARTFLIETYGAEPDRIALVPHGIPDVPFVDPNFYKDQFGVEGRKVLLTFGLLSRSKGIETMIRALPRVAERHADSVYVVLGATHPHVRRHEGESYRASLAQLARQLGVADRVIFHDRFVGARELAEFLGAADVYVTPYGNEEQIVSGTLSYAMGAGKAIVSTPYFHARDMLAEGRGRLVPFRDPDALAGAIVELLDDEPARHAMRKRAYTFTRDHVWPRVGERYLALFAEIRSERRQRPRPARPAAPPSAIAELPELDLGHLVRLTDDVGVLQHALYYVPAREHGYCTDDNARALVVALKALPFVVDASALEPLPLRYLAFLVHAFDREPKAFRNFFGYDRRFLDERGSPDCHGRAIGALGVAAALLPEPRLRALSTRLLGEAIGTLEGIADLRPMAFALLGLGPYLAVQGGDSAAKRMRQLLADRLFAAFEERGRDPGWPWPEEKLTYANAVLPHALLEAGEQLGRRDWTDRGLAALDWVMQAQLQNGRFSPIGNLGWHSRGGPRARFDQQPIEAEASLAACLAAFRAGGDESWLERALVVFRWFLGDNDAGQPLADPVSGGCRDGVHATGVNENQGAESTLAWLASLVHLHELEAAGQLGGRLVLASKATAAAAGGSTVAQ